MKNVRSTTQRVVVFGLALATPFAVAAATATWDQVANVKAAASQIGEIHRRGGVDAAFKFISACYKTHSLASAYSKPFEGCIAQDYMQSRALALVYERIPVDRLKSMGAPTAQDVLKSMSNRVGAAFGQYKISKQDGQAFLKIVDAHEVPAFFAMVFPKVGSEPKVER